MIGHGRLLYEHDLDAPISAKKPSNRRDRTEYHKKYYQEHKQAKKDEYKEVRQSKKYYMSQRDVTATIRKLQPQIGRVNAELILSQLKQVNKIFIDV